LYAISRWRVLKENGEKHLECIREILELQKVHSEKLHFPRSRIVQFAGTEVSPSEETWGEIDEYEDRDAYDKMAKAMEEDPEIVKLKSQYDSKWEALIVPGSLKTELWTERLRYD